MDDIVITGMGAVCSIGDCCYEMLKTMRADLFGIRDNEHFCSEFQDLPAGILDVSDHNLKLVSRVEDDEEVSRTQLMAQWAMREALETGYVHRQKACSDRPLKVVLVNGTTVGGMDLTEQEFSQLRQGEGNADCMLTHDCGATTEAIARHFGNTFSEWVTVSTACSSGANAIALGAELLRSGRADIVVAGGTEALTRFHMSGFNSLMILDHAPCRPFDKNRAGLNLGEGAAYVVMEREKLAWKISGKMAAFGNCVDINAYLSGYGNACDAFHQTATSDNGEGPFLAMTEALQMAGLKAEDISYVNAHGTGTPNNDLCESVALRRVFGEKMPPVSSTKGYTGHATSAAGAIETIISLLALQHDFIPMNRGWKEPGEGLVCPAMDCHSFASLEHVMCNSFGFGGNDTSLIFSKKPTAASGQDHPDTDNGICELARVEISDTAQLSDVSEFVKPMEARRMSRLMKAAVLSSMRALKEAGVDTPDAIITATAYGAIELSERLLNQLCDGETLKPTWFMQSTHNTIAGELAIRTRCHGYNITYSQGDRSLQWAMDDARRLIRQGRCRTVLVECHDETTPLFRQLMERVGRPCQEEEVKSLAVVLSCGKSSL